MILLVNPDIMKTLLRSVSFTLITLCLTLAASAKPLNVLFIAVDDLNDWVGVFGGHPQAKTNRGHTPLHNAALYNHKGVAELLIANGADVNAKDAYGFTPLDEADDETADLLRKDGGKTRRN